MKQVKMIFQFYSRNVFSVLVLLIVMTLAVYSMSSFLAQLRFITYAQDVFKAGPDLPNAVYYMPFYTGEEFYDEDAPNKKIELLKKQKFNAVKQISNQIPTGVTVNGMGVSALTYDSFEQANLKPSMESGKWFTEAIDSQENTFDIVVGGARFSGVNSGDTIQVEGMDEKGKAVYKNCHVIGKMSEPFYAASYSASGTFVKASDLLRSGDSTIIFRNNGETADFLRLQYGWSSTNFFVSFHPDATQAEKDEVLSYLQKNGAYKTYDEILAATKEQVNDQIKKGMPMPLFFLFISTMALISISVLLVSKKLKEYSVYYLCGCGKRRCLWYMFTGISLLALLACILNIIYIKLYPLMLSEMGLVMTLQLNRNLLYDNLSILYIFLYMLAIVALSLILPCYLMNKSSPIEFYRRKSE